MLTAKSYNTRQCLPILALEISGLVWGWGGPLCSYMIFLSSYSQHPNVHRKSPDWVELEVLSAVRKTRALSFQKILHALNLLSPPSRLPFSLCAQSAHHDCVCQLGFCMVIPWVKIYHPLAYFLWVTCALRVMATGLGNEGNTGGKRLPW